MARDTTVLPVKIWLLIKPPLDRLVMIGVRPSVTNEKHSDLESGHVFFLPID